LVRTLLVARELYENSTATDKLFDIDRWLGRWLVSPAMAFGWQRPIDWYDTPTAAEYARYVLRGCNADIYL
jgi:uncharacterized protein (DUF2384 family)